MNIVNDDGEYNQESVVEKASSRFDLKGNRIEEKSATEEEVNAFKAEELQEMDALWQDIADEEKELGLQYYSALRNPFNVDYACERIELTKKLNG